MNEPTTTLSNPDFIRSVLSMRRESRYEPFRQYLWSTTNYHMIIQRVNERTMAWNAENSALCAKVSDDLRDDEKVWKKFFEDHTFSNYEEERAFSDALSIITGLDLNRFIKPKVRKSQRFPSYIALVPVGKSNGHCYPLGKPIFNFSHGTIFHMPSGEYGDNMSSLPADYRIPDMDETDFVMSSLIFRVSSACENLVSALL